MGMLSKVLGLKVAQKVVQRLDARADAKDARLRNQYYLSADQPLPPSRGSARGQALMQRAGNFYHQNPKLVASVATLLLAGVAAALAKKRGMY